MTIAPSLLLLGAQLLVPVSDRVPTLNVEPSCRGATEVTVAVSQSYEACMRDENSARAQLVQSWQTFSAAERIRCTGEASMGGLASYVELLVCLQVAGDKADQIKLKGARRKK
jgi:hypothetical protein